MACIQGGCGAACLYCGGEARHAPSGHGFIGVTCSGCGCAYRIAVDVLRPPRQDALMAQGLYAVASDACGDKRLAQICRAASETLSSDLRTGKVHPENAAAELDKRIKAAYAEAE